MEKSLDFVNEKVRDNETEIQKLKIENASLRQELSELRYDLASISHDQRALESRQESAERRSREWGIRVHGVPVNKINGQEDTRAVLTRIVAVHKLAGLDILRNWHPLPLNTAIGFPSMKTDPQINHRS